MKDDTHPALDHAALIRLVHERFERMSKTHQRIAVFLTQNPNDVAMLSVNTIANRCGVHASSFVRFAQSLGYTGFKELQGVFHERLATAAPGFEARIEALERQLGAEEAGHTGHLRDLVARDITALQDLLEQIPEMDLQRAGRLMELADTLYLAGQLRSAPVVELLRYLLTMLGLRVVLLDPGGGLASRMAETMGPRDLLIAVSFRYYAEEVVEIADAAAARGTPVIAITDTTLSPLARASAVLFAVPEHTHAFSRSLAAPMCLAQALGLAVAGRLQGSGAPRIPVATED